MAVWTNSVSNAAHRYFSSAVARIAGIMWLEFDLHVITLISCSTSLMHGSVNVLKAAGRRFYTAALTLGIPILS